MTLPDRDASSADALLTDLYLDALLAGAVLGTGGRGEPTLSVEPRGDDRGLDPAARAVADRLRRDLVRVHPSFRFEERLATRLAEAAMSIRIPAAAGAEGRVVPFREAGGAVPADVDPVDVDFADGRGRDRARPLIIGGALTSAALSLAGAAIVAWRRGRPGSDSAMRRAARAAHAVGGSTARRRRRTSRTRSRAFMAGTGRH